MSDEVWKYLKVAGVIAGVVVVGVGIGWLGSRSPSTESLPTPVTTESPVQGSAPVSSLPSAPPAQPAQPAKVPAPLVQPVQAPALAAVPANQLTVTNWEDRVDDILSADTDESVKANQMLAVFPQLPEEGQVEVAQHISNLISDQDYPALGQYLTNSTLPSSVLDVLLAGLLNRPNSLKMPLLLDIARNDQNPIAGDARDMLSLFLEEDYGQNWNQWQAKMNQWLQDNPD